MASAKQLKNAVLGVALIGISFFYQPFCESSTERRFDVPLDQLWSALVKSIAIDYAYEITRTDQEVGYVLFKTEDGSEQFSAELLKGDKKKAVKPRVRIDLKSRPKYEEIMLLDRLSARLRKDFR